nr:MAG TPA: helix-turn-helix domain protein [Caudoviricetes sp.]
MNCRSLLHIVYHRKLVKSMHINEFAEILLKSRKQKGFSQSELAKKAGFTKRAIQYWEKGEKSISLENADKLFKALDVQITIGTQ